MTPKYGLVAHGAAMCRSRNGRSQTRVHSSFLKIAVIIDQSPLYHLRMILKLVLRLKKHEASCRQNHPIARMAVLRTAIS